MSKIRRSPWTIAFHEAYGPGAPYDTVLFVRLFKLPRKVLDEVEARGFAAARKHGRSDGYGWARARVYKFLLVHVHRYPLEERDADADLHEVAWKDMAKKMRRS